MRLIKGVFITLLYVLFFSTCNEQQVAPVISDYDLSLQKSEVPFENSAEVIFGLKIYMRLESEPTIYEENLDEIYLHCYSEPFTLFVINGDGLGNEAVTSAIISIDEAIIFQQSDFNKKVTDLNESIQLTENSILKVEVRGKPGTYMQVYITGIKNPLTNLLVYYPFNGNTYDKSCRGNHGIPTEIEFNEDRYGNLESSAYFNGIDSKILFTDKITDLSNGISLSCWIKSSNTQGEFRIPILANETEYYGFWNYHGNYFYNPMIYITHS